MFRRRQERDTGIPAARPGTAPWAMPGTGEERLREARPREAEAKAIREAERVAGRFPIEKAGSTTLAGSQLVMDGWAWRDPTPGLEPDVTALPERMAGHPLFGWTVPELHSKAHGAGCRCPVATAGADGSVHGDAEREAG